MTCEQCKYHSYIDNTHFCDSRNHKRRTVRISQEDAKKDMECYWADKGESEPQEISDRNLKMWEEIYAEENRRESEDKG